MNDRDMALDALETLKHEIVDLTKAAEEASNQNVRQAMIQFRNKAEQTQMQLAELAAQNGWYTPSPNADDRLVQDYRQQFMSMANQAMNQRV